MGVDHLKNLKNSDYGERARRKMNTKYHTHILRVRCGAKERAGHGYHQVEVCELKPQTILLLEVQTQKNEIF